MYFEIFKSTLPLGVLVKIPAMLSNLEGYKTSITGEPGSNPVVRCISLARKSHETLKFLKANQ